MSTFMTKKEKAAKLRAQVKSRWYYIFWGTATITVFVGQVFVGNGFRRMAESFEKVLDSPIQLDLGIPKVHKWDNDGLYHPTDPPQKLY